MRAHDQSASAPTLETEHAVLGPWSLPTVQRFYRGFSPSPLPASAASNEIRTVFRSDADWQRVEASITQQGPREGDHDAGTVAIRVRGEGDLEAATAQVLRFLSLDIDAREWPDVGARDAVVAEAQRAMPGLRPCGFHSPYEAAVWAVLSQRIQMRQAARLRDDLIERHGDRGAMPSPKTLLGLDLDLPGRKGEYLRAVAAAAIDGALSGARLRALGADAALSHVREIHGLGPFAGELVLIRGALAPDVLPQHEPRLNREIAGRYGPDAPLTEIGEAWRPYRSWAALHLRALAELNPTAANAGRS